MDDRSEDTRPNPRFHPAQALTQEIPYTQQIPASADTPAATHIMEAPDQAWLGATPTEDELETPVPPPPAHSTAVLPPHPATPPPVWTPPQQHPYYPSAVTVAPPTASATLASGHLETGAIAWWAGLVTHWVGPLILVLTLGRRNDTVLKEATTVLVVEAILALLLLLVIAVAGINVLFLVALVAISLIAHIAGGVRALLPLSRQR